MKAKTTPRLYLQDFAKNAVSATALFFVLLFATSFDGYGQVYPNGESYLSTGYDVYALDYNGPNAAQPFNASATNSRIQYLYLDSEFNSTEVHTPVDASHKNIIKKIAFQMVSPGSYNFQNFTVRMGYESLLVDNWTNDEMESHTAQNMITVFGSKPYSIAGVPYEGWAEIILDQPFEYDPALGHLIVEIAKTCVSPKPAYKYTVKSSFSSGMKMSRGCKTASGTPVTLGLDMYSAPALTSATVALEAGREYRPNIKITYQGHSLNSNQEIYEVLGENACKEGPLTINLTNSNGTDISYQWQVNRNGPVVAVWEDVVGANAKSYTTNQNIEYREYRCKQSFLTSSTIGDRSTAVFGVNTYSAGTWSNDGILTPGESVRFSETVTYGDLDACKLYVDAGVTLTISENSKVSIAQKLRTSEVQGSLIFKDKSTLYQYTSDANENIDFTYQRETPLLNRYDFTYYSAPTFGTTLGSVSPNTLSDKYFEYDDSNPSKWISRPPSWTMKPGFGYIIRGPQTVAISGAPETFTANFSGKPNNGDVTIPITSAVNGYNLIGNPYPSAVSAKLFLEQYDSQLDGTIYFWTHFHPISTVPDANGIYQYNDNSYAAVNGTGSTLGVEKFRVASGQSFMVRTIEAISSVTWKNSFREYDQENIQFYKNQNGNQGVRAEIEPEGRIWLELRGQQGKYQKMLIGFLTGATEEYDNGFDAEHMQASDLGFYSISPNQQELGIMAKGMPFDDNQIIPIGYSTTAAGPMTIVKFLEDGFFKDYSVFINDKLTNTSHNLSESAYDFNSTAGTFNSRFIIAFKPNDVEVVDPTVRPNTVVVYDKAEALQLHSTEQNIKSVVVYDMSGRIIARVPKCDSLEVALSSLPRTNKLILVEIQLENGTVETQKFQF